MTEDLKQPESMLEQLRKVHVAEPVRLSGRIEIVDYDPSWPLEFERHREKIVRALGEQALMIEHAGSTSVPGLAAKPRIDIVLVVPDSSDESSYVPPMEAAGYELAIREPDWFEHRVFKRPDVQVNVHVFSRDCPEIDRMLLFRDWLRAHPDDRNFYAQTKRELAGRDWEFVQEYADEKTAVVEAIIARALVQSQ